MTAVVFMLSVLSLQLRSGKVQGGSRPSPTISMIHMTHKIKKRGNRRAVPSPPSPPGKHAACHPERPKGVEGSVLLAVQKHHAAFGGKKADSSASLPRQLRSE